MTSPSRLHPSLLGVSALVMFSCLLLSGVAAREVPARAGSYGCTTDKAELEEEDRSGPCPRHYLKCEGGYWRRAMCVAGTINTNTSMCDFNNDCPEPVDLASTSSRRHKRQASTDCSKTYSCPQDISSRFIYPDWSNANCDSYVVCIGGQSILSSCLNDNLRYYNARTLSCEEVASRSNLCVYRAASDLSPISA